MSKELSDSEVNQIIAEFMGWKFKGVDGSGHLQLEMPPMRGISFHKPYTKSLDALIPVWEKLNFPIFSLDVWIHDFDRECTLNKINNSEDSFEIEEISSGNGETIQQAAARATARAILALGVNNE